MVDANTVDLEGDGEWGEVIEDALIQIHSIVLPNGKVFAFGTDGTSGDYDARFVYSLYDPVTGDLKVLPNTTGTNIFCSNMSIDPQTGNVIIMGGDNHNTGEGSGTWSGRNDVVIFDYETETIRNVSEEDPAFALHEARWYGTTINLANGEILILGGRDEDFNGATSVEIYNHETGMRQLSGIDIPDMVDGDGTLTGVYYYPHVWQVSDGSVIMIESGGTSDSGHDIYRLDINGEGSIEQIGVLPFPTRNLTSSMMYEPDKVIVASTTGEVWKADLSQSVPTWELAFTITDEDDPEDLIARTNGTFVMMPDGRVAMVGGSSSSGLLGDSLGNAQKTVFFWDPETGETSFSEAQDLARMYHSSALILPTGEVYSGGSGSPGPQENANFQILTPDYLFDDSGQLADRPEILQSPSNVDSGSNFRMTVDDTSDISQITFIKSGASTHARNADARFMELEYTIIDNNTVQVEIPDANVAIPGLWMLYVIDNEGVPSVASMTGVDMVDIVDTGNLDTSSTIVYNIDDEQIDGAFALAVTVRFDDLNGSVDSQTVFDLGNGTEGDNIRLSQIGTSTDLEFVITQDGQTYRVVAENAIVEGEEMIIRVGIDADGIMRITKDGNVLVEGQGVVPADVERGQYLIGESADTEGELVGLVRDLKIANYGNFAELDPNNDESPCATTGEAVCLCNKLVPDVDDTEGNDAAVVFDEYSILNGDVTELENGSRGENQTDLTYTGIIAFADADTADLHTATLTPQGSDYLGSLTIGAPTTTVEAKTGSITWNFVVNDAELDSLEEGQQVIQYYDVAIDDGNGAVPTTTLSVTLIGTDDSVPQEEDFIVVENISPTSGDDTIILGDNIRLMNGDYFEGGENRFEVGNYFELRDGNLDFDNSDDSAYFSTGLRPRLFGGDIRMDEGGIDNTLILGNVAEFSLIKMDGDGAGTRNSVTIGNSSKSDDNIDMDSSGTAADWAQIDLNIGNVVEIGGKIDADGNYAARDFDFGYLVTVHGNMDLSGNASTSNDVKIGQGLTVEGVWYGSYGLDNIELAKDWNIDGPMYLYGGDDVLSLGMTVTDSSLTYFYAGAGNDTLKLDVNADDLSSFESAARAVGWEDLGDGNWNAKSLDLNWNGMYLFDFENIEISVVGGNDAPVIVDAGTTNTGSVTEIQDGVSIENNFEHKTNGTIQFNDVDDIGEQHSVTITPDGEGYLGEIQYTQPTSAQFGLLPWVFAVQDADLDGLEEGEVQTQTYTVTITDPDGASVTESITIELNGSDDPVSVPPVLTLTESVDVIEADAGEVRVLNFSVYLDKASDVDVTADVSITGDVTGPSSITIPAGETSAVIAVTSQGDNIVEPNETVIVSLSNLQGATGSALSASSEIQDNDSAATLPVLNLISPDPVSEGGEGTITDIVFIAELDKASDTDVTATVDHGGFFAGPDSVTIPAGQTSAEIVFKVWGNEIYDATTIFAVSLINIQGDVQAGTTSGSGTVLNDDPEPVISISAPADVAEGATGESGTMVFTVNLDGPSGDPVSADVVITGNASGPVDFLIPAGETSTEIAVTFDGDDVDEADETITVTLENLSRATGTQLSASAQILDDDEPVQSTVLELSGQVSDFAVYVDDEGGYTAVRLSTGEVYDLTDVTAVTLVDIGETYSIDVVRSVAIPAPGEDPVLTLTAPDDVSEGDVGDVGEIVFTVSLDKASDTDVTATVGISGNASGPQTVTIAAGTTTANIVLSFEGDEIDEADETITVTLFDISGATGSNLSASAQILDDDEPASTVLELSGQVSDFAVYVDSVDNYTAVRLATGESYDLTDVTAVTLVDIGETYSIDVVRSVAVPLPEDSLAPVIIDLDGDGTSFTTAEFDFDSDGEIEMGGWSNDGFLALDRNGDGVINNGSELSFVQDVEGAKTDLEGLKAYDSNGDGSLTSDDEGFDSFVIWTDSNQDGDSQSDEMQNLVETEIVSIDLDADGQSSAFDVATIHGMTEGTLSDGSQIDIADTSLHFMEDSDCA